MSSQSSVLRIMSSSQKGHQQAHEATAYCCSWDPMGAESIWNKTVTCNKIRILRGFWDSSHTYMEASLINQPTDNLDLSSLCVPLLSCWLNGPSVELLLSLKPQGSCTEKSRGCSQPKRHVQSPAPLLVCYLALSMLSCCLSAFMLSFSCRWV